MKKQTNVFNDPNFVDPDPILPATKSHYVKKDNNYKLDKVVALSRHNIRSPFSGEGSILSSATPYNWYRWTSAPSELSLRGKELEIKLGHYFREYCIHEGLFDEDWKPLDDEIRIYANSKERTVITADKFIEGFVPESNVKTEYHCNIGEMDPVFASNLLFASDTFSKLAMSQIESHGGEKGLQGICETLSDNYDVLKEVLDFYYSDYYKQYGDFRLDDTQIVLNANDEPRMKGTLGLAVSLADALTLQFYEEEDLKKAAFGDTVNRDEWIKISEIIDVGVDMMFAYSKAISVNVSHNLVCEIKNELLNSRKFSLLCGHDANIIGVLSSINVNEYYLPNTISRKTPIGCKLVIEKWVKNKKEYATVSIVYQNVKQLRNKTFLDLENPPEKHYLEFKDLETNEDGYYLYSDLLCLFDKAIEEFDKLPR